MNRKDRAFLYQLLAVGAALLGCGILLMGEELIGARIPWQTGLVAFVFGLFMTVPALLSLLLADGWFKGPAEPPRPGPNDNSDAEPPRLGDR
jgi:hypothetical protein